MEKERACLKCAGPAAWVVANGQTWRGIPSGYEYTYQCTSCGAEFSVLGNGQFFWSMIGVAGFLWFASSFIWQDGSPHWSNVGAVLVVCAAGLLAQTIYRVRVRMLTSPNRINVNGVVVR